jgi:hypothetical protein
LSSTEVTVIVAVPTPTATTLPSESTVATSSSLVDQVTSLLVASSGNTVTDKSSSSPVTNSRECLSNVTLSTWIITSVTVT